MYYLQNPSKWFNISLMIIALLAVFFQPFGISAENSNDPPPAKTTEEQPESKEDFYNGVIEEYLDEAENGNAVAKEVCRFANYSLGKYYEGDSFQEIEKTVPDQELQETFQRIADREEPFFQFITGYCYFKGLGVPKELQKAFKLFQENQQLVIHAKLGVGLCYIMGYGTDKNVELGVDGLAGLNNYPPAEIVLGDIYTKGAGVKEDLSKALKYYVRAGKTDPRLVNDKIARLFLILKETLTKKVEEKVAQYKKSASFSRAIENYKLKLFKEKHINIKLVGCDKYLPVKQIEKLTDEKVAFEYSESEIRKEAEKNYPCHEIGDQVIVGTQRWGVVKGTFDKLICKTMGRDTRAFGVVINGKTINKKEINRESWIKLDKYECAKLRKSYIAKHAVEAKKKFRDECLKKVYQENGYVLEDGKWLTIKQIMPTINDLLKKYSKKLIIAVRNQFFADNFREKGWIYCGSRGYPIALYPVLVDSLVKKGWKEFNSFVPGEPYIKKAYKELFDIADMFSEADEKYRKTFLVLRSIGISLRCKENIKRLKKYKDELNDNYDKIHSWNKRKPGKNALIAEKCLLTVLRDKEEAKKLKYDNKLATYKLQKQVFALIKPPTINIENIGQTITYEYMEKVGPSSAAGYDYVVKVNGMYELNMTAGNYQKLEEYENTKPKIAKLKKNIKQVEKKIVKVEKKLNKYDRQLEKLDEIEMK